jgi:hypothetical protein
MGWTYRHFGCPLDDGQEPGVTGNSRHEQKNPLDYDAERVLKVQANIDKMSI